MMGAAVRAAGPGQSRMPTGMAGIAVAMRIGRCCEKSRDPRPMDCDRLMPGAGHDPSIDHPGKLRQPGRRTPDDRKHGCISSVETMCWPVAQSVANKGDRRDRRSMLLRGDVAVAAVMGAPEHDMGGAT